MSTSTLAMEDSPNGNRVEVLRAAVLLVLTLLVLSLLLFVKSTASGSILVDPVVYLYSILVTLFQLSRLIAALMYHRAAGHITSPADASFEPTVTFVIPCKDEVDAIGKTVRSCFLADYPSDKLEVIVIDDGSTDGTGAELASLQRTYPGLVVVSWEVNQGKRQGMAEGIQQARGEIIVQLDSDSYIEPSSFRELVTPFIDESVGAVCAHADPANADVNMLTRMQAAYYFFSFRILKAAEATFHVVFCCSGCCSAYRRSLIEPMLEEWLEESFLGKPVTWGDDRALTNRVLEAGFKTMYTDRVQAFTIVPETFRQLLKQQVRWKKGWMVNSLRASRFIARVDPFVAFTYFFPLVLLTIITPFMAVRALVLGPIITHTWPVSYLLGTILIASLITVYYRHVAPQNRYWPYVFAWSALNMVVLSFVLFFAVADIGNRSWGTR